MTKTIEIIDRGRGPQLSTSRITVQDVAPYLLQGWSHERIRELMPVLTVEEIGVVERYVAEHWEEVLAEDRRIREESARRRNPPEVETLLFRAQAKMDALREEFRKKHRREDNGAHPPG